MQQRFEPSTDDEKDHTEYTLKVARVADHAFMEHDVDSESSSGDCGDGDDEEYEDGDEGLQRV